jgi:hypothetical protein
VSGSVGDCARAVGLAALAVVPALTTEGPLVDLAFLSPGEGQSIALQLVDSGGSLLAHIVDGVLVAKPVTSLDGVIGMPFPVVLVHVSQGCVDAALRGNSV